MRTPFLATAAERRNNLVTDFSRYATSSTSSSCWELLSAYCCITFQAMP